MDIEYVWGETLEKRIEKKQILLEKLGENPHYILIDLLEVSLIEKH